MSGAKNSYDYLIAGGGMAGLSLAFYLNENRILRDRKVLIVDRDAKTANDHTWCFWEKTAGAFEEIVFHRWKSLWFHGADDFSRRLDLDGGEYKMIRAADFYPFVFDKIEANPNFDFLQTEILSVEGETLRTQAGDFTANDYIFDSFTSRNYDDSRYRNMFQHFRGWLIETGAEVFDAEAATLFDFRVEQKNECRFVYILPISPRRAMIEFTVFSDNLLRKSEYEFFLNKYIREILRVKDFKILETEAGVIPMSDAPHNEFPAKKIIRIGTAGGYIKPSTGYSFRRAQIRLQNLVGQLSANQIPKSSARSPKSVWKKYLDSVLLDVLLTKKHPAADVFTHLFRDNPTALVLKFLDEETSFAEDSRVMRSVPLAPFGKAAAAVLSKKIRR